jgi:hypothetical protein
MATKHQSPTQPNFGLWKMCAYAGFVFSVGLGISWAGIAGFLPPPVENWNADQVYQFFSDNSLRIRIGIVLALLILPLYFVLGAALARLMEHIEGPKGPLSQIQLMGSLATTVVGLASFCAWLSCSFAIETKTPQDIKTMSDMGWMWFNPTGMVTGVQFVSFGVAALLDKNPVPLIPRWVCWFCLLLCSTLLLALLTPFLRTGPWAWDGLYCYYMGLGGFFLWVLVASWFAVAAIKRLEAEARN